MGDMAEIATATTVAVTLGAILTAAFLLARERATTTLLPWPPPRSAVAIWLVVAIPSLVQIPFPAVLRALERDRALLHDGHWWRILTSGLVQDGGLIGTAINLSVLALVLPMAIAVWGVWRTVFLLFVSQLIVGLTMASLYPSNGAGNSGATLALAASVVGLVIMSTPRNREMTISWAVLVAGAALVLVGDIHGFGVLTGALMGAAVATVIPPVTHDRRSPEDTRSVQI
ncbi:MAG: rhomboid family intramembrane serine protease [Rhodococcus sp.]|nr:rhomboid family intramembrane serine protease [Rhodococcus sp. (in: high G+C Gram-positive bacteria)]